jgi:hypothetical protein
MILLFLVQPIEVTKFLSISENKTWRPQPWRVARTVPKRQINRSSCKFARGNK